MDEKKRTVSFDTVNVTHKQVILLCSKHFIKDEHIHRVNRKMDKLNKPQSMLGLPRSCGMNNVNGMNNNIPPAVPSIYSTNSTVKYHGNLLVFLRFRSLKF